MVSLGTDDVALLFDTEELAEPATLVLGDGRQRQLLVILNLQPELAGVGGVGVEAINGLAVCQTSDTAGVDHSAELRAGGTTYQVALVERDGPLTNLGLLAV